MQSFSDFRPSPAGGACRKEMKRRDRAVRVHPSRGLFLSFFLSHRSARGMMSNFGPAMLPACSQGLANTYPVATRLTAEGSGVRSTFVRQPRFGANNCPTLGDSRTRISGGCWIAYGHRSWLFEGMGVVGLLGSSVFYRALQQGSPRLARYVFVAGSYETATVGCCPPTGARKTR